MKKIITCLLAAIGLTSACGQQNFESVDVEVFSQRIQQPDVVLLDVRTAEEYAESHIKGALNIDQSQSDFLKRVKEIPMEKTIAVYCRSGRRSSNAASKMAAEGYRCVNLKGGIIAWAKAGKPVVSP